MKRRQFSLALSAGALGLVACQSESEPAPGAGAASGAAASPTPAATGGTAAPSPQNQSRQTLRPAMGTNLSGMEWARPGLRYGTSSAPNLHFTVPRAADVAYLASNGFTRNRLPIQWELLQPMLHDTPADSAAQAAIGSPGAFHPGYQGFITSLLNAHAAAGITCILDLHNYCRYQDFRFQGDGSVTGLTTPANPLLRPYTSDRSQVQVRIFSLASGSTLTLANFTDFWARAARLWQGHPGLGGYGLMNEPHDLPVVGGTTASTSQQDLRIWPTFAQAAIHAIRAEDRDTPIYVSGNDWNSAMSIGKRNPGFPLVGTGLVYEVHLYLDAFSNGHAFDWDTEVAKNYSAGVGNSSITTDTGQQRLTIAVDWARSQGVALALTEVGMPVDDPRWEASFQRAVNLAALSGCEVYSWMGGNHWPIRNYAINHVPGWHQDKTLEPAVAGPMKAALGLAKATLFDDGPGYALGGTPLVFTVYVRGHLSAPLYLTVSSSNGGSLSKTQLIIPAGANGQDSFSLVPGVNRVTTLSYTSDGQLGGQVPPSRQVFSLSDPVADATTRLADAALALIAKYSACLWKMADGHTDYLQGAPAAAGQPVRAIADSGYGSSPGNAMEMLNWINTDANMGAMSVPVMGVTQGRKHTRHAQPDTHGFWCKKSEPVAGIQPHPRNRVPYRLQDAHFAMAALSVPGAGHTGTVFQASKAEAAHRSELRLNGNQPEALFVDANGQSVPLTSATRLGANTPVVLAFTTLPGAQRLRVNAAVVASASASFAPSTFNQLLLGWGFLNFYPRDGFQGHLYAVITGQGSPSEAEMTVMERYLASTAGQVI